MTDPLLEQCANAMRDAASSNGVGDIQTSRAYGMASAIIAIARPAIERECFERAAKICDFRVYGYESKNCMNGTIMALAVNACASEIRALIPKDTP